jgi:serine/threonine-protein kinase
MKQLGVDLPADPRNGVVVDKNQRHLKQKTILRDGPVIGVVSRKGDGVLPEGTLLYGQVWTGDEKTQKVKVRYTEAQLPGQSGKIPICAQMYGDGLDWDPGSKPGAVAIGGQYAAPLYLVEKWDIDG